MSLPQLPNLSIKDDVIAHAISFENKRTKDKSIHQKVLIPLGPYAPQASFNQQNLASN